MQNFKGWDEQFVLEPAGGSDSLSRAGSEAAAVIEGDVREGDVLAKPNKKMLQAG